MKFYIISSAVFVVYLIAAIMFDWPKWLAIIPFVFTIGKAIYDYWKNEKSNSSVRKLEESYQKIIEEQNSTITVSQTRVQELEKDRKKIESVLSTVNEKLKEENVSKEELIKDLKEGIDVILVLKHVEGQKKQTGPRHITEILKKRGFKNVYYGLWLLPPSLAPKITTEDQISKWTQKEILKKIPTTYRHKLSVMIVDLKKVFVAGEGETRMKSIFEKIDVTDLVSLKRLNEYLRRKKNISLADIIQLPRLSKLVKKEDFGWGDANKLLKNNDRIIIAIGKQLGVEDIKINDICKIDENILKSLLDSYKIKNSSKIANDIIENSKFWNNIIR